MTTSSLRTEDVIINSWNGTKDAPLVSIICNTYNHQHYIASAIESFLKQITDFPIEILIHDDASTDRTPEIIRNYEKRFPNIIKPIYQKINQYSKEIRINPEFNYPRTKGIYIALCEGDDYWSDPFKLQVQVEHMVSNPETSVCVHASSVVKSSTGKIVDFKRPSTSNRYFSTDEIITGGGGLFATNSMLFKRLTYVELPPYILKSKVGDYPLMIYLSTIGNVYYLDRYLSVYRTGIRGSWTSITHTGEIQKTLDQKNISIELLHVIDRFYDGRYASAIRSRIHEIEFEILQLSGQFNRVCSTDYADLYVSLSFSKKMMLCVTRTYYPVAYSILKRMANFNNRMMESIYIQLNTRYDSRI